MRYVANSTSIRRKNWRSGIVSKEDRGRWWISLPQAITKSRRRDERPVPELLNPYIDVYLTQARPVLLRGKSTTNALWISAKTSGPMHALHLSRLISQVTLQTIGIDVSPHLASALLNHT